MTIYQANRYLPKIIQALGIANATVKFIRFCVLRLSVVQKARQQSSVSAVLWSNEQTSEAGEVSASTFQAHTIVHRLGGWHFDQEKQFQNFTFDLTSHCCKSSWTLLLNVYIFPSIRALVSRMRYYWKSAVISFRYITLIVDIKLH